MSKAVMYAIKPKYCELIKKKMKTAEVRKRIPILSLPYKCYIYQTGNGGVIGEFICDYIKGWHRQRREGKLSKWREVISKGEMTECCLDSDEYETYAPTDENLYASHISELIIYAEPKPLTAFGLYKPPQSWCYVEELK